MQYYNEPALKLFPVLKSDAQKAVDEIKDAIEKGDAINIHKRIYIPEENELSGGGEILGRLYSMVDSTELKKNEYKLKADAEILQIAASTMKDRLLTTEELMKQDRFIGITARYKEQLLLEIVNACEKKAELDEDGHPYTDEDGHGIGTRSVLAFVEETDSEIMYVAEEKHFKVRMIIG